MKRMKKIWFLLVMLCSVCAFTACSDDDEKDDVTPVCPVTNVALDKTVALVGEEVVLSGKGFAAGAKLYLKGETSIAISDLTIAADGTKVTFTVPEAEAGDYPLMLQQGGDWTLDVTLTVKKVVVKKLSAMTINFGDPINFKMNYTEGKLTSVTQTKADETTYDYFIFQHSNDSIYLTADMSGTFQRKLGSVVCADGRVNSFAGNAWAYNEEKYLQTAVIGGRAPMTVNATSVFENGNLTSWSLAEPMASPSVYTLKYEGSRPEMKGIDAGLLLVQLFYGNWQNPLFMAQLLDMAGEISDNLPSAVTGTKLMSDQEVTCNITAHEIDGDGYITKVVIDDQLKYNKELIITFVWE